ASASIALRSPTTTPPAAVTAARICAGVEPGEKRTTVTPKGLPAAVADPVIASAAANVARRRVGRITVQQESADSCRPASPVLGIARRVWRELLVVGVRGSFADKDAGSVNSHSYWRD